MIVTRSFGSSNRDGTNSGRGGREEGSHAGVLDPIPRGDGHIGVPGVAGIAVDWDTSSGVKFNGLFRK
jgi:hypothetical protein